MLGLKGNWCRYNEVFSAVFTFNDPKSINITCQLRDQPYLPFLQYSPGDVLFVLRSQVTICLLIICYSEHHRPGWARWRARLSDTDTVTSNPAPSLPVQASLRSLSPRGLSQDPHLMLKS